MCLEASLFLLDEKDLDSDDRRNPMMVSRTLAEMVCKCLYISTHSVNNCKNFRLTSMMMTMVCCGGIGQVTIKTMPMAQTQQLGVAVRLY